MKAITVSAIINASKEKVWECWTEPRHIVKWNFASEDWEAFGAKNDLRTGGSFSCTMAAKDRSAQFDFAGTYTNVKKYEIIEYVIVGDGRKVRIEFTPIKEGIEVNETFEMETVNSEELQRQGWQAILNNFKSYVENN